MATRIVKPTTKKDGIIESNEQKDIAEKKPVEQAQETPKETIAPILTAKKQDKKEEPKLSDEDIWGKGFTIAEYKSLNTKFNSFVKYYPLRTEMHREALITYLKYAQLRDRAIENDLVDEADKWGKLAAKQAQDAKINPSQLSLADLSNGIANFGKLVETVEKVEDVIPILPQYLRHPRDEVDYALWLYVQYSQRMANMPESSYDEIYKFVTEKYNHNKRDYEFLVKEENKRYKGTI